jgi:hypothetical protein
VLFKSLDPAALGDRSPRAPDRSYRSSAIPIRARQRRWPRRAGREVHDFSAWNDDLEDALALMGVLDEYAGVSNTNMHLRAGLGRTANVLVPFPPEWRWQGTGGESPWFPAARSLPGARRFVGGGTAGAGARLG